MDVDVLHRLLETQAVVLNPLTQPDELRDIAIVLLNNIEGAIRMNDALKRTIVHIAESHNKAVELSQQPDVGHQTITKYYMDMTEDLNTIITMLVESDG